MDLPLDTTAEAHAAQIAAYRLMGESGRAAVVFRLNALVREAAMAGIRGRHPENTTTNAGDWPTRGWSSAMT